MGRKLSKRSYDLFSGFAYYTPGFGGVAMLILMFATGVVLGSIISLIMLSCFKEIDQTLAMSLANVVSYPFMFIPVMLYCSYQSRSNQFFGTPYPLNNVHIYPYNGWQITLSATVALIAMIFVCDGVSALLPPMSEKLQAMMDMLMNAPLWLTLLSVSVFAPIFEEWLCRGMILRGLLRHTDPKWAILTSAFVFALIHLNIWQAIPAFFFGLLFGYAYYKTGSLKLVIFMHCLNNTASALMGRAEMFKDVDSFYQIMPHTTYFGMLAMCIVMLIYFVVRMEKIWKQ